MVDIAGLGINFSGMFSNALYWIGYVLLMLLVIGGLVLLYFLMGYKYKVTVLKRGGTGEGNVHSINKIKKDRGKEVKVKGVTKFKLLFARKEIQPVNYEYVYPGNNIFLYQSGNSAFHPIKVNCSNPKASFEQIPSDVSFWMGLTLKEVSNDYSKQDFWTKYGNAAVMAGTVLFCLILVGVTIYYTYQHANGVTGALGSLTGAIKSSNVVAPY